MKCAVMKEIENKQFVMQKVSPALVEYRRKKILSTKTELRH